MHPNCASKLKSINLGAKAMNASFQSPAYSLSPTGALPGHPCQSALTLGSHFISSLIEVSIETMPVKALCKARERNYTYVNCPPEDVSVLSFYLVCKRLASWLCELQAAGNKDQQHPPCYLPSPLFLPRLFDSHQLATDPHKPWTCPSACQDPGPKRIL